MERGGSARTKPASEARQIMLLSHLKGDTRMKRLLFGRLSWEEQTKNVERLTQKRPPKKAAKKEEPKKLGREALAGSIHRLYTAELDKKKQKEQKREKLFEKERIGKELPEAAVGQNVQTLCYSAVEHQKNRKAHLRDKHLFAPKKTKLESIAKQKEVNGRLYTSALDKKKDEELRLEDLYITSTDLTPAKRTEGDWGETLDRLYVEAVAKIKAGKE
eukprot:TRINITY_DN27706_c0_g1_i1.p1 TRINITY_DN27706_c0_g1~~TRINITY_DN27706_c0_g1_i1.p1  ORF type:complete len:217 (+),score=116.35 TRINITY_DN27706_c0_g1_i1:122-772(+)